MNIGASVSTPVNALYGRQVPLTNESGEPVQLVEGDKVTAEVMEVKPDGTLTLKMPNGQRFLAEILAGRTLVPGQRVALTVTEVRGGVPMVEITGEGASSAETFLKAMKAPSSEFHLALARESLLQQAPFTPKQFAALIKTAAAFEGLTPEQAVFMAKHNIPINRETVARYQAVTQPQAQLGALLQKLLDILPAGKQAPPGTQQPVQLPQSGTVGQAAPQPVTSRAPMVQSAIPSSHFQPVPVPVADSSAPPAPQTPQTPLAQQQVMAQPQTPQQNISQAQVAQAVYAQGEAPAPPTAAVAGNTPQPLSVAAEPAAQPTPPATQAQQPPQTVQANPSAQAPPQGSQIVQSPQSPLNILSPPLPSSSLPSLTEPVQTAQTEVGQTVTAEPAKPLAEASPAVRSQHTATQPNQAAPQPETAPFIRELLDALFARVAPGRNRELPWELDPPKLTREIGRLLTSVIETARELPVQTRTELLNTAREIVQTLRFAEQINHCAAFAQLPITINGERTTAQLYVFNDSTEKKKIDPQNATLFVSLKTANLGTVEGFIKVIGTGVEADFSLRTDEAAGLFCAGLPELAGLLEARGYRLERVTAAVAREEPLPPAAVEKGRAVRAGRYRFNRTV
ncbi:MAG: hypothetical protein LBI19_07745 [Oscillospiraceae bacterium]|jgi:hypothetical protein|nr:hypothetical protein [Oscillospiraceae bacterium]